VIEWQTRGIGRSEADGRYVRRFVGATLAVDSYLGDNASGPDSENVLATTPGTAINAGMPSNASPILYGSGDAMRAAVRLKVFRENVQGVFAAARINGSFQAPTGLLINQITASYTGEAVEVDTGLLTQIAQLQVVAQENVTSTQRGARWRFFAGRPGSTTQDLVLAVEPRSAGVSGLVAGQSVQRSIPAGTWQLRNAADTASVIEWGANTLGFYNAAPIAKPTVTGAKGGNAALTSLLTQLATLGLVTDSTT
jgi:hypothetical protein